MSSEYKINYVVFVGKKARKDGSKLGLSKDALRSIIEELKLLKHWPEVKDNFDYENVNGALKFNFDYVEGKWIRVFVYQDDERKIMWVFKVIAKKTNKLVVADLMAVDSCVREIELEIRKHKAEKAKAKTNLKAIEGGKK